MEYLMSDYLFDALMTQLPSSPLLLHHQQGYQIVLLLTLLVNFKDLEVHIILENNF